MKIIIISFPLTIAFQIFKYVTSLFATIYEIFLASVYSCDKEYPTYFHKLYFNKKKKGMTFLSCSWNQVGKFGIK